MKTIRELFGPSRLETAADKLERFERLVAPHALPKADCPHIAKPVVGEVERRQRSILARMQRGTETLESLGTEIGRLEVQFTKMRVAPKRPAEGLCSIAL